MLQCYENLNWMLPQRLNKPFTTIHIHIICTSINKMNGCMASQHNHRLKLQLNMIMYLLICWQTELKQLRHTICPIYLPLIGLRRHSHTVISTHVRFFQVFFFARGKADSASGKAVFAFHMRLSLGAEKCMYDESEFFRQSNRGSVIWKLSFSNIFRQIFDWNWRLNNCTNRQIIINVIVLNIELWTWWPWLRCDDAQTFFRYNV